MKYIKSERYGTPELMAKIMGPNPLKLLEELMQPEYEELFMRLTGSYQDIALSDKEVAEIMEKLPADLSEERKQVVLTAYQLLGKVNYFWGGKSLVLGWDSRWGTPMEVTAAGSSSSWIEARAVPVAV